MDLSMDLSVAAGFGDLSHDGAAIRIVLFGYRGATATSTLARASCCRYEDEALVAALREITTA
jgi:hypothetical protein